MDNTAFAAMTIACLVITVLATAALARIRSRAEAHTLYAMTALYAVTALCETALRLSPMAVWGEALMRMRLLGLMIPWIWAVYAALRLGFIRGTQHRFAWMPAALAVLLLAVGIIWPGSIAPLVIGPAPISDSFSPGGYAYGPLYLPLLTISAAASAAALVLALIRLPGSAATRRETLGIACVSLLITFAIPLIYLSIYKDALANLSPFFAMCAIYAISRRRQGAQADDVEPVARLLAGEWIKEEAAQSDVSPPVPASLPGRTVLTERLQKELGINERLKLTVALVQIDLEQAEDARREGASADPRYERLAAKLREILRKVDTVTVTEDGLFIIVPQIASPKLYISGLINRLYEVAQTPFNDGGHEEPFDFNMGVTLSPEDGSTVDEMITNAGMALAFSRSTGKNRYTFYDLGLGGVAKERWRMAQDLKGAADRGEMSLLYQPLIKSRRDGGQDGVTRFEALLRWERPLRGTVSPGVFIPIAEEFGLTREIGAWAIRQVCGQIRAWRGEGAQGVVVSVNLSLKQLFDPALKDIVSAALEAEGIPAASLEIEIEENAALNSHPAIAQNIEALRALGVHVTMDSFSAAQSSLLSFMNFPLDEIKLDSAFLADGGMGRKRAVMHAISVLCGDLDIPVTVKGVETEDELAALKNMAYDMFQGYYFSKPLEPNEAFAMMKTEQ